MSLHLLTFFKSNHAKGNLKKKKKELKTEGLWICF